MAYLKSEVSLELLEEAPVRSRAGPLSSLWHPQYKEVTGISFTTLIRNGDNLRPQNVH